MTSPRAIGSAKPCRCPRRQLETVLDSAPDLIARFDAERRFTYANPAWEQLLGIAPVAMVGTAPDGAFRCRHCLRKPSRGRVALEILRRTMQRFESAVSTNGGEVILDTRCVAVSGTDDEIDHVLTFSRDTTPKAPPRTGAPRERGTLPPHNGVRSGGPVGARHRDQSRPVVRRLPADSRPAGNHRRHPGHALPRHGASRRSTSDRTRA